MNGWQVTDKRTRFVALEGASDALLLAVAHWTADCGNDPSVHVWKSITEVGFGIHVDFNHRDETHAFVAWLKGWTTDAGAICVHYPAPLGSTNLPYKGFPAVRFILGGGE